MNATTANISASNGDLATAIAAIAGLITSNGAVKISLDDILDTVRDAATVTIAQAQAQGDQRVSHALNDIANTQPDILNAGKIIVNLCHNPEGEHELAMAETGELHQFIGRMPADTDVIWGISNDTTLDNDIKVTIIAAHHN